ncbi:polyphosphate kinase 1 [Haloferacaceae archaeon DSL9]
MTANETPKSGTERCTSETSAESDLSRSKADGETSESNASTSRRDGEDGERGDRASERDAIVLSPETWQCEAAPRTPPIADPLDASETDSADDSDSDAAADAVPSLDDPRYYLNRELGELSFQWRVLHEALDERNPPLERLKFLNILTQNLDEFFMKRIGGLKQQLDAGVTERTPDGLTPREQWRASMREAAAILKTQSACYHEAIHPLLADAGIEIVGYDDLEADRRRDLRDRFERSILPTLTPLTFDPAHPFPFISNLSLSLAVVTRDGGAERFSRVKIPKNRPRLMRVGDRDRFVPIERVIQANLDLLFPNVEIVDCSTFRVTRNAEVRRNEEVAEGLIDMIEDVLRQRRFATVVRLEVAEDMPTAIRELLTEQFAVAELEVFELPEPIAFDDFWSVVDLDYPALKRDPWTPKRHPRFADLDGGHPDELFAEIDRRDVLVHHPYHSFTSTVQTFLDTAAHDPDVLAIKAAIYRTAPDSRVIGSLIEAAKNGKQVAVMVELKARFDEENNLRWVKRLEEEGIHVAYGTIGLKTHSKVALAVREEGDAVKLYSHVASGNYHSETAKTYVDLGLFTADSDIGYDLVRLFNSFTGHARDQDYRSLLVAPEILRPRLTELIRQEAANADAGRPAKITAKMNALEDPKIVEALYEASQAGVGIDLFVRGICRLRPGVDGVSETVNVHSVVGRFLEHSRIFRFENAGDPRYFVGSADWMTRNLDRRVEAVAPVEEPTLRSELDTILETMRADNTCRWEMRPDGSYIQMRPETEDARRNTHEELMERARRTAPDERQSQPPGASDKREPNVDLDEVYLDSTLNS